MQLPKEELLRYTILNAPIGICLLDAATLIAEVVNDKFLAVAGKPYDAIYGKSYWEPFAEARPYYEEALANVIKTGEPFYADEVELMLIRHDREEMIFVTFVYAPVKDETGQTSKVAVWVLENTKQVADRQKVEAARAAFQQERDRLKNFFMQAPAGICILDGPELVYELVNPAYQQLLPGRELLRRPIFEALPEIVNTPLQDILLNVYGSGESFEVNELLIPVAEYEGGPTRDRYFTFNYLARKDSEDRIDGVFAFVFEVTAMAKVQQDQLAMNEELSASNEELTSGQEELQQMNSELAASQYQIQSIVNNAPFPIGVYLGRELRISLVNQAIIDVWGKGADVVGKLYREVLPELEGTPVYQQLDDVFTTGKAFHARNQRIDLLVGGKMKTFYFNYSFTALADQEGEIYGVMNTAADVTDVVLAKQEVELTSNDLAALNEEMAASNEELQATNEELAAVNEELATTNDELVETQSMLQKTNDTLSESEARFNFLLNAIPQQVWTARPDGTLNYVNEVVSSDFGKTQDDIVGHGWQAFIHADDLQQCLDKWVASLQSGKEYLVEFRLLFADGQYHWHLARAKPLIEDGRITLWLGTNTNIEPQKRNELKKDEFLSIASHELKTPLTSIKAFNQLLQRAPDAEKMREFAGKSAAHVIRLEKLISDLLDVTRLNAGKMVYDMQDFDFHEMLVESVESVQATASNHQIIMECASPMPFTGDRYRLEQVVVNFLTNAVKYSPQADRVIVNCQVKDAHLIVSIQDFGIGIARENLDKLFDRYYRVDNTAMRFDGLGLGLYISSEILKRHTGSFWIESEPGNGSTFYFRLPLNSSGEKPAAVRTKNHFRDEYLTITYHQEFNRLDVDWTGFQDLQSVQHGCILMWEFLKDHGVDRIVNDNTHVQGNWSDAVDWVGNTWFPMMEQAGLKYFAHIFSPSIFSQLAAQKSIDIMAGIITTQYFTEVGLAIEWIDSRPN
ncbi:MAG: PAS domain-containing protein [Bacteroidota bacterium]